MKYKELIISAIVIWTGLTVAAYMGYNAGFDEGYTEGISDMRTLKEIRNSSGERQFQKALRESFPVRETGKKTMKANFVCDGADDLDEFYAAMADASGSFQIIYPAEELNDFELKEIVTKKDSRFSVYLHDKESSVFIKVR